MSLNFVSYVDLQQDIVSFARRLPPLRTVYGLGRSGAMVANLLALHANCMSYPIEVADRSDWFLGQRSRGRPRQDGIDLLLDDCVGTGRTLGPYRHPPRGAPSYKIGALYYTSIGLPLLDYGLRRVDGPRVFEWNMFHCDLLSRAAVDIDGVLCENPDSSETADPDWALQYIDRALPRYRPTWPIGVLLTSRLERHRARTEAWLHRHGIQYGEMIMFPGTVDDRRRIGAGQYKADAAVSHPALAAVEWFIESEEGEARDIARATGKTVICTNTMTAF